MIYYVSFHNSYRHLLSYNFEAVHGFTFGVDAIKSILLMCAVVDKRITVEEAVRLSRLEVDFQVTLNCRQAYFSGRILCMSFKIIMLLL